MLRAATARPTVHRKIASFFGNDRKLLKIVSNREAHKSDVDRAGTEADKLFTCRHVSEFNLHLWSTPAELRNNAGNQVERVKAEPDTEHRANPYLSTINRTPESAVTYGRG